MNPNARFAHPIALALVALLAAADARAQGIDPQRLAAAVAKIDSAMLAPPGALSEPAFDALAALHPAVAGPLLTGESFQFAGSTPNGVRAESPSWTYEWRPQRGAVVLQVREGIASPLPPVPGGDGALVQDALARLASLGIESDALTADVRRVLTQTKTETGEATPPAVHAIKVFLERNQDIEVENDETHVVVTYGSDRRLRKLLLRWPSRPAFDLAPPAQTPSQVALAIGRDLVQHDEDDVTHRIAPAWMVELENGQPRWKVEAMLLDAPSTGENDPSDEKIRIRRFDPSRANSAFCDVETSEATYGDGQTVEIPLLRFANHTGAPLPARVRFQIRLPFGLAIDALDLNLTLPAGIDRDLADPLPISLFTVGGQPPQLLGDYELRCRIEDPTTGAPIAEDVQGFFVEISGLSPG